MQFKQVDNPHLGVILQDGTKGSLARRIAGFFRMKRLKK